MIITTIALILFISCRNTPTVPQFRGCMYLKTSYIMVMQLDCPILKTPSNLPSYNGLILCCTSYPRLYCVPNSGTGPELGEEGPSL